MWCGPQRVLQMVFIPDHKEHIKQVKKKEEAGVLYV